MTNPAQIAIDSNGNLLQSANATKDTAHGMNLTFYKKYGSNMK